MSVNHYLLFSQYFSIHLPPPHPPTTLPFITPSHNQSGVVTFCFFSFSSHTLRPGHACAAAKSLRGHRLPGDGIQMQRALEPLETFSFVFPRPLKWTLLMVICITTLLYMITTQKLWGGVEIKHFETLLVICCQTCPTEMCWFIARINLKVHWVTIQPRALLCNFLILGSIALEI